MRTPRLARRLSSRTGCHQRQGHDQGTASPLCLAAIMAWVDHPSEAERRQREADSLIIGLTQHALETADAGRLAGLIGGFLTSDNPDHA